MLSFFDEYCTLPGVKNRFLGGGSKADSSGLIDCIYAVTTHTPTSQEIKANTLGKVHADAHVTRRLNRVIIGQG